MHDKDNCANVTLYIFITTVYIGHFLLVPKPLVANASVKPVLKRGHKTGLTVMHLLLMQRT